MTAGEQIALAAMKKEFKRLSRLADNAKAEAEEYMNVASEFAAIHTEFAEVVNSKEHGEHVIKKLDQLKRRRDKALKIHKKDFMKLLDKETKAALKRDSLFFEIQRMEFRLSLRNRSN